MRQTILALLTALYLAAPLATAQDEPPIRVQIISPTEDQFVTDETVIELQVVLAPGLELAGAEVFLDGRSLGARSRPPLRFPVGSVSPASVHRIRAVARTAGGASAEDVLLLRREGQSDYSVRVDLVTLYVSVTDQAGNHVRGLSAEDFEVLEDGSQQQISYFSGEYMPLTLALLMDVSSSMLGERIIRAQAAATELVETLLRPDDQAMVLGFDHRLLMFQPLTGDKDKVAEAIALTGPDGGTALYDAAAGTARKLFSLQGKRVIVLLSDGDDTDSRLRYDDVLDYLQRSGVLVYTVGLQTLTSAQTQPDETRRTIRNLQEMAEVTGGQAYFPSFISHLPGIYAAIGQDLASQYTISYYPSSRLRDGTWRSITVRVRGRPELALRHRNGYYAEP